MNAGAILYRPVPALASIERVLGIPPPFYSVAFGNGLSRSNLHCSTDSSYFTMSLTGAACWLRYMDTMYHVPPHHPPSTSTVSASVADAILRRPESQEARSLCAPRSTQPTAPSCPSLRLYEASLALSNNSNTDGLQHDAQGAAVPPCEASILAETMPSLDDLPEIPDEDAQPAVSFALKIQSDDAVPNTSPTTSSPSNSVAGPVSEKPSRKAKGLVKQYRAYKPEARPTCMGRPTLPTILEDAVLERVSLSLPPRGPKSKKRRGGQSRPKTRRGDENLSPLNSPKAIGCTVPPGARARVSSFSTPARVNSLRIAPLP
ncbi:hypothetical protein BV20DRAFT_973044 [Pilatotrama ljubarskyi]|nr:hypothetical protein BV20DRAFT_973044 [Pilatotrama ljubarskyi]